MRGPARLPCRGTTIVLPVRRTALIGQRPVEAHPGARPSGASLPPAGEHDAGARRVDHATRVSVIRLQPLNGRPARQPRRRTRSIFGITGGPRGGVPVVAEAEVHDVEPLGQRVRVPRAAAATRSVAVTGIRWRPPAHGRSASCPALRAGSPSGAIRSSTCQTVTRFQGSCVRDDQRLDHRRRRAAAAQRRAMP